MYYCLSLKYKPQVGWKLYCSLMYPGTKNNVWHRNSFQKILIKIKR